MEVGFQEEEEAMEVRTNHQPTPFHSTISMPALWTNMPTTDNQAMLPCLRSTARGDRSKASALGFETS